MRHDEAVMNGHRFSTELCVVRDLLFRPAGWLIDPDGQDLVGVNRDLDYVTCDSE